MHENRAPGEGMYRPDDHYERGIAGDDPGRHTRRGPLRSHEQPVPSTSSGPGTTDEVPTTQTPPGHGGGQPEPRGPGRR